MKDTDVAIRYARALFQAAQKKGEAGQVRSALGKVSQLFRTQPELSKLFLNPVLPRAAKEQVVQKVLPAGSPRALENFLKLLIRNKRLDLLHWIVSHYDHLADVSEGLARVHIRSPQPLSESQRKLVLDEVSRALGQRAIGEFSEAPELLGGFVLKMDDRVVDLSILGQLSRLKENLLTVS